MTTEKHAPFVNTLDNTDFSTEYSYLLNFWHTSKINKEYEFIPRNGVHPDLRTTLVNDKNGMRIVNAKITSIATSFYTVFRMMLSALFEDIKITKNRNADSWNIEWNSQGNFLDIDTYNMCYYAWKHMNQNLGPISIVRPYPTDTLTKLGINLINKDKLHTKDVLDSLGQIEDHAKTGLDARIFQTLDNLMQATDLKHDLELVGKKAIKKKTKVEPVVVPQPVRATTTDTDIVFEQDNNANMDRLRELLPIYQSIAASIQGMPERIRFSYVLQYARAGTNPNIRFIQDTDTNHRNFMTLIREADAA